MLKGETLFCSGSTKPCDTAASCLTLGCKKLAGHPVATLKNDVVNHPSHYTQHPSGVECIQITEHMGFNLGNAVKYIWRCDLKKDAIEDLKKAKFYIEREIALREKV